jgi:hypothetical protein
MTARWLAPAAFVLWLAVAAGMIGFAGRASLAMAGVGAGGACLVLAAGLCSSPPHGGAVAGAGRGGPGRDATWDGAVALPRRLGAPQLAVIALACGARRGRDGSGGRP